MLGVGSETYSGYNGLYAITGITTAKEISVTSVKSVSGFTTIGVGATLTSSSFTNVTGVRLDISSLVYNNVTGLATVTTVQNHGLVTGNPIQIAGRLMTFTTNWSQQLKLLDSQHSSLRLEFQLTPLQFLEH